MFQALLVEIILRNIIMIKVLLLSLKFDVFAKRRCVPTNMHLQNFILKEKNSKFFKNNFLIILLFPAETLTI
jgi:hypothetical protein